MSEANLWARMRGGIADRCFAERIENMVGSGCPDVMLHAKDSGRCALIELKARSSLPIRANTPVFTGSYGLRPDQVAWCYSRACAGAAIFVLGQCADELWLVHGRFSRELSTYSREMLNQRAAWVGKARRTDWEGMLDVIFG